MKSMLDAVEYCFILYPHLTGCRGGGVEGYLEPPSRFSSISSKQTDIGTKLSIPSGRYINFTHRDKGKNSYHS